MQLALCRGCWPAVWPCTLVSWFVRWWYLQGGDESEGDNACRAICHQHSGNVSVPQPSSLRFDWAEYLPSGLKEQQHLLKCFISLTNLLYAWFIPDHHVFRTVFILSVCLSCLPHSKGAPLCSVIIKILKLALFKKCKKFYFWSQV